MAQNWDITKLFSLSNLIPFFIVLLVIPGWFGWALLYDPPTTSEEFTDLTVQNENFWQMDVKLRPAANVSIVFEQLPQSDIYFLVAVDDIDINRDNVFSGDDSDFVFTRLVNKLTITHQVQFTSTYSILLWSTDTVSEDISFTISYDNPEFGTTDQFTLIAVFMVVFMGINFIVHWKQLRYFRYWIKAKLAKKDLVINQEANTDFGHEEFVKSFEEKNQDKMDSVFGKKKD